MRKSTNNLADTIGTVLGSMIGIAISLVVAAAVFLSAAWVVMRIIEVL